MKNCPVVKGRRNVILSTKNMEELKMVEMTIKNIKPKIQYLADGIETRFFFPFVVFKPENVTVYFGAEKQTSGFEIRVNTDGRDGGFVVFDEAPEADTGITIVRRMVIERTSDFQAGGAIRAEEMNYELDYRTACEQQLADDLSRSITLPPYVQDDGIDFSMPLPDAGKAIVWSADGKSLENSTVEINNVMGEIENARTQILNASDVATQKIAEVEQAQAGLSAQVAQASTDIADSVGLAQGYATEVNTKIAQVTQQLASAQQIHDDVVSAGQTANNRITQVMTYLSNVETRCDDVELRLDDYEGVVDEMRDIQTEVSENADRVQEYVDTMDTVSGLRAGEIENTGGHTCDLNSYVRPATFLFSGDTGMGAVANAPTGQMAGFLQVLVIPNF